MITVYKVVFRSSHRLYSNKLYSAVARGEWMVEYIPGEFVYPTIGFLFAYEHLDHAISFAAPENIMHSQVWRAETTWAMPADPIPYGWGKWHKYWESPQHYEYTTRQPRGTLFCDDIKLIERIS